MVFAGEVRAFGAGSGLGSVRFECHTAAAPSALANMNGRRRLADTTRYLVHRAPGSNRTIFRDQRRRPARDRVFVFVFDQQPVGTRVAAAVVPDANEHPTTSQPFPRQNKFEVAGLECVLRLLGALRRPKTAIPHLHGAAAIFAFRDRAFEVAIVEGMIFHLHGQAFVGGIDRRAFGDCPRLEDAVQLQSQVVVQMARGVLLNHVPQMLRRHYLPRSAGFLGLGEIALCPIGLELRRCPFHTAL